MEIKKMSETGNVSIPKSWRDELGLGPHASVIIEKVGRKIVIEPLSKGSLAEAFKDIDDEIREKGITITMKEAVKDDLYD